MKKKTIIIGIETSCDETAVSILRDNGKDRPKILSNVVSSQFEVHKKFGGVVPDLAARAHLDKIDIMTKKALQISKVNLKDIDAVAATAGPGLIVCLSIGLNFAKALALSLKKPFIAINHLEGHALSPKLNFNIKYPYLLFLISGGHTQYLTVKKLGEYKRLGTTIDDALGEVFDKTAKLLNLGYPGGPIIEKLAKRGNENKFILPKPIFNRGGSNLSFAGLKTAILRVKDNIKTQEDKKDLAASFQKTVLDILNKKTKIAIEQHLKLYPKSKTLVVAGGVAVNKQIRRTLKKLCQEENFNLYFPDVKLCTDNAAMIALAGLERFKKRKFNKHNFEADPRWQLDDKAKFMKGAGVKI